MPNPKPRKRGRPPTPAHKALTHHIGLRLDRDQYAALARYRESMGIAGLSDALVVRNVLMERLAGKGVTGNP